jgi:hypothetical protein
MSDISVSETVDTAEKKAKQLPDPKGFRILCMVPKMDSEYESRPPLFYSS